MVCVLTGMKELNTINLTIVTDSNVVINNEEFFPDDKQFYNIEFMSSENKFINVELRNNTLKNIHFHLNNDVTNIHVVENNLNGSAMGITMEQVAREILIEGNSFRGHYLGHVIKISDTKSIFLKNNIFHELTSNVYTTEYFAVMSCKNSDIRIWDSNLTLVHFPRTIDSTNCSFELFNVSFTKHSPPVVSTRQAIIHMEDSKVNLSDVTFVDNRESSIVEQEKIDLWNYLFNRRVILEVKYYLIYTKDGTCSLTNVTFFNNAAVTLQMTNSTTIVSSSLSLQNDGPITGSSLIEIHASQADFTYSRFERSEQWIIVIFLTSDLNPSQHSVRFTACNFTLNTGVLIHQRSPVTNLVLSFCMFQGNYVNSEDTRTSLIYADEGTMEVNDSAFYNNSASAFSQHWLAGIVAIVNIKAHFENCQVSDNCGIDESYGFLLVRNNSDSS